MSDCAMIDYRAQRVFDPAAEYSEVEYRFPYYIRLVVYTTLVTAVLWPRYLFLPVFGIGVNPFTITALLGTALIVIFAILQPIMFNAWGRLMRRNWLFVIAFLLVIAVRLLSCYTGEQVASSAQSFVRDLPVFMLFPMFMIAFIDNGIRQRFSGLILTLAAVQMLLGILEFSIETSIAGVLHLNTIGVGDAGAMEQVGTARIRDGAYRAQALFQHPIVLGQFAAAVVPLAASVFYRQGLKAKLIGLMLALLCIVGALVTGTRSAFVLLAVGLIVFYVMGTRKSKYSAFVRAGRIYLIISIGILATIFFVDSFYDIVVGRTGTEVGSTATRQTQIQYSLEAIRLRPLLGYGLGNGSQHSGIINQFGQATLDNFYLTVALDSGLIGLLTFILFILLAISVGISAINRSRNAERYQAAALLSFFIVLMIGQTVQSIIDTLSFQMIAVGWLMNAGRKLTSFETRPVDIG